MWAANEYQHNIVQVLQALEEPRAGNNAPPTLAGWVPILRNEAVRGGMEGLIAALIQHWVRQRVILPEEPVAQGVLLSQGIQIIGLGHERMRLYTQGGREDKATETRFFQAFDDIFNSITRPFDQLGNYNYFHILSNNFTALFSNLTDDAINTEIEPNHGLTPLTAAAIFGRFEMVQEILRRAPTQKNLNAALYRAIQFGHLRITQILIERGARLNAAVSARIFTDPNWLFWYRTDLKEPLQKVLKKMTCDYATKTATAKWMTYAIALPLLTISFILQLEHISWGAAGFFGAGVALAISVACTFYQQISKPVTEMLRFKAIPDIEQNPATVDPNRLNALLDELTNSEKIPCYSLIFTLTYSSVTLTGVLGCMLGDTYPSNLFNTSLPQNAAFFVLTAIALLALSAEIYAFKKQQQTQPTLRAEAAQQPATRGIPPTLSPYNRFSFFGRCAGLVGAGALGFAGFQMTLSLQIAAGFWMLGFFISNVLPELHAYVTSGLPTEPRPKIQAQQRCALALASFGALGLMGTLTVPSLFHLSLSAGPTPPLLGSIAFFSATILTAMGLALYRKHQKQHLEEAVPPPLFGAPAAI